MVNTDENVTTYRDNIELSYPLYSRLKGGEQVAIVKRGLNYCLAFHGDGSGGENCLEVTSELGGKRKYGWGCYSDQILHALGEMDAGWDQPQRCRYKPLQKPREIEAV